MADLCTGGYAFGSKQSSTSEGFVQAFDNNFTGSKWVTADPAYQVDDYFRFRAQLSSSATVLSYQLTSGNDAPERDPADWTLQASNDAVNWVILDTQTTQTFGSRGLTRTFNISNAISYAYYRLSVTKVLNISSDSNPSNDMQLAEWRLWTGASGTGTNVALTATMTSSTVSGLDPLSGINDNSNSSKTVINLVSNSAPQSYWIGYRLTAAAAVNKYTITSGNDASDRDPAAWVLQGSSDGAIWFDADTRSSQTFSGRNVTNTYNFTNTIGARLWWRLKITARQGGGTSLVQLSEIEMEEVVTSISGTLAVTEAPDTAVIAGTVVLPGISGTLGATEAPDAAVINGTVRWNATLDATEAPDTALIQGTVATPAVANWEYLGTSTTITAVTNTTHALSFTGIDARLTGDVLVACLGYRTASTTSVTLPSGWTLLAEQKTSNTATPGTASGLMAYCIRGASDPSLSFTYPVAPSVALGTIVAYRPLAGAAVLDTFSAATIGAGTSLSLTGLTTAADKDLLVFMTAGAIAGSWSAFNATDPGTASSTAAQTADVIAGTWQERVDASSATGADVTLAIADAEKATAGATGSFTATAASSSSPVGIVGAFKFFGITGTIGPTEAPDTALISGALGVVGTLGATEALDTALINATTRWDVAIAAAEAPDTALINVTSRFNVAISALEAPDTALINGTTAWNVTFSATEAPDTALIAATATHGVIFAATEALDTALINATTRWSVAIAATEALDTALINVTSRFNVAISALEAPDTADISGSVFTAGTIAGAINAIEAPDTALIQGAVTGVAGTLTATEAPDTALINGATRWNVTIAASEALDTALINGATRWNVALAALEAPDTALINGTVATPASISGTLNAIEARDAAAITGTVPLATITGILSAIEASDIALFTGSVPIIPVEPGPEPTPLPPSQPGVLKFGRRVTISRW